jgi:RimJ/RimL family protein N-acetyltransferase
MEIVPYNIQDSQHVAAFFREIFKEWRWTERPSDHMDEPHRLFHLPDEGALLLVKENNIVIGTAGVIMLRNTDALIKRFYLAKVYRGSGIAKNLLNELIKQAESLGSKKLILDVSKENERATHFYEKNKFLRTDVTPQEGWPESFTPETHYYFYRLINTAL